MSGADNGARPKNIYQRGADDGLWLGVYVCVLFFLCMGGFSVGILNVVALAMMAGVPALTYVFLRRTHEAAHGMTTLSGLWMQGIVMFACGSLILGAVSFVYLRWIDPGMIHRALLQAVDAYEQLPGDEAAEMAKQMRMLSESRSVLTPLNMAFGWMWLGMLSGSLLSLIMAAIVRARRPRNRQ